MVTRWWAVGLVVLALAGCGESGDKVDAELACEDLVPKVLDDLSAEITTTRSEKSGEGYDVAGTVEWSGGEATWVCTARDGDDGWTASSRDLTISRS